MKAHPSHVSHLSYIMSKDVGTSCRAGACEFQYDTVFFTFVLENILLFVQSYRTSSKRLVKVCYWGGGGGGGFISSSNDENSR